MRAESREKIIATRQKYLQPLLEKELPEKLEKQIDEMDWSVLTMIDHKEQKRGSFSPPSPLLYFVVGSTAEITSASSLGQRPIILK